MTDESDAAWGGEQPDPTASSAAGSAASAEDRFLAAVALDETVRRWPKDRPGRERRTPIEKVCGTLMDTPGEVRRLVPPFATMDEAFEIATVVARMDPTELVPGAPGWFEATPVRDVPEDPWQLVVRYLETVPTFYPDFQTWMAEWLTPTIRRPLRGGVNWCPEWWRHPEAVARLDALWAAWEAARAEGGTGMAYWWDLHFDSHWSVLSSDRGPFAACKDREHASGDKTIEMLPCASPPEDWPWPSDRKETT